MTDPINVMPRDAFDPTAEMGFDEGYGEYVPPIEKPADYDAPVVKEEVPAAERIAATFAGMPGNEKLLAHVIDFCREGRASEDVHEEIRRFVGGGTCTYAPEVVCANLARAGALDIVAEDADELSCADDGAAAAADGSAVADEPQAEGAQGAFELGKVGAPPLFSYAATAEGLEVVDARDPEGDRLRFLEEGERYLPVYRLVLEECARSGGATKKVIDGLVDHHPLCKEPRRYSGFFVKGLEGIDAISFDGAWQITEVGRGILAGPALAKTN
ncbi:MULTISPECIES: hypothetical protein [unclassified Adlercreutzia]|uniref:hypothetical protein n=1 Tax=unclassified Adlercreutzia TaxID=2636013 RepID=UPI0013EB2566|nr:MULTISPECIES: hypothetical protein [unclassified Adlercreutzia]